MATVPWLPWLTAVTVSASLSGSLSLPRTAIVTGVSSPVLTASALATGASLTFGPTVTVTLALLLPPWPSLMRVGEAVVADIVRRRRVDRVAADRVDGDRAVAALAHRGDRQRIVVRVAVVAAGTAIVTGVSSPVLTASALATGASLTFGPTVTVTRGAARCRPDRR